MSLQTTCSQTVGPYFRIGLEPLYTHAIGEAAPGVRIEVSGHIVDGSGMPINDAVLEIWQADGNGVFHHPEDPRAPSAAGSFQGFGRVPMDAEGRYRFTTVKPGRTPGPEARQQAPHLAVLIFMRGLLKPVLTRLYFDDEAAANAEDPVLALVPPARRATLLARREGEAAYVWNLHLQGEHEIVAFSC